MAEFLVSCNGVGNTLAKGNSIVESTEEAATVRMEGKCALVQGWEGGMGLSQEEVAYLCEIASYGDFGHAEALGLNGTWLCTSAQEGCDHCELQDTPDLRERRWYRKIPKLEKNG